MRILILGDSFSDPTWASNTYRAWPELLSTNFDVTNMSVCGSSLWWSYRNLLKHQNNYDYTVFVVTMPNRIYLEPLDKHINVNTSTVVGNVLLEEVYFRYFYSPEREQYFHNSIMNSILQQTNILVIPAFAESFETKGWSLCHFADYEADYYKKARPVQNDYKRKCHLTKENNEMVYDKICEAILKKNKILELFENDFRIPLEHKSYYWAD